MTNKVNVYDLFPYDSAYKFYKTSSSESKAPPSLGLFEIDSQTKELKVYRTMDESYYNVYLLKPIGPFLDIENIEDCYNLLSLTNLRLDMREGYLIKVPLCCKIEAILLVNIKFYTNFHIMMREGMTGVYGIQKVY
jgi:hypothetical protein